MLNVTVTVVDNINPVAIAQNITLQLDAAGNAITTADAIDNSSTDNCSITGKSLDVSSFTCSNLGINTVVLTVTDQSGNENSTTATVTVVDAINPVAIVQNITVELDASGNAATAAEAIDNNSTDNCSITNKSLDVSSFTCANLGANAVVLTVTDQSGNENSTAATVTVEDNINPVAIGQDIMLDLAGNASVSIVAADVNNGSTDNCEVSSLSIDEDTFTEVGVYPVVLTATDSSGNTNDVTVTVTVGDTLSVEDFEDANLKVFPNPTQTVLNIQFKNLADYSIKIFDINGKELMHKTITELNNTIDVSGYAKGIYLLQISSDNSVSTKTLKIIKY
jgi:hypothetical protein